ncbi:DUF4956 domain-containing protein [Winogradskya consettensis]|uniref:DUF4956 domain-containing protein n=1 Tax=Winogradskya consettensis TaxID=113560 RepID=A0A919VN27_9ACTN|nr:DUF4956 domain-containing protein [Actinoplanes consettensis]GIM69672.1 DUF4956 domain-containing protein [Actinoplanes consettensis]
MTEIALLGAELTAVTLLVLGLYFPRHRRWDLVVAYFGVNVGVLAVSSALRTTESGAGLGMGLALFGVLSIIRLRSTELDQTEVAYYFSALALGLLGSLATTSIWWNIGLMVLVVAVIATVDNRRYLARYQQQIVVLDVAVTNHAELVDRLEILLGARVHSARTQRIDLINESTVVDVRWTATRTARTTRPAEMAVHL